MSHDLRCEAPAPVRTAADADALNALWLASVVLTYDGLAWQSHSSVSGIADWANTENGYSKALTSPELVKVNLGRPLTIVYDAEVQR